MPDMNRHRPVSDDRVQRLLGAPALTRVIDLLVRRCERGRPLAGILSVPDADSDERFAIAALFGRSPGSGTSARVDLDRLDAIVRDSGAAPSLRAAVERLRGPIIVRPKEAERMRQRWDAAYACLDPLLRERPEYRAWAIRLRETGLVRRLAGGPDAAETLLERVAFVLAALPADGESLQRLAVRTLGSAHALDRGTAESTLVLSAVRGDAAADGSVQERRRLWQTVGVALDELSSTVLVHRLPLLGALGELTAAGEPVVLTLRQMRTMDVIAPAAPVFVCENPSVVEAAAREIPRSSAALVCVGGQPSFAADLLLRRLAPAGLRYHGDFDWGGIRIANRIHNRFGFEPWRYLAADYDASDGPGSVLTGTPVDAAWDPGLRGALERRGIRIEEERNLDVLLADLASARGGGPAVVVA